MIPSPGAGSDAPLSHRGYPQAPGGPEFDEPESQSNQIRVRVVATGNRLTILLSASGGHSKYRDATEWACAP